MAASTSPVERRFSVVWPVTLLCDRLRTYGGPNNRVETSATFSFRKTKFYFELHPYVTDFSYELVLHREDHGRSVEDPFEVDVVLEKKGYETVPNTVSRSTVKRIPQSIWRLWLRDILPYSCRPYVYLNDKCVHFYKFNIVCTFRADTPSDVQHDEETTLSVDSIPTSDLDTSSSLESLSDDFGNLLRNETLPDVKLKCGDRVIPAHRTVLAARSGVFAAMFSNEMSESRTGSVDVEDLDQRVFDKFLEYLYSGRIAVVPDDVVPGLYAAADKYAVQDLKAWCRERMLSRLTEQNCVSVLTVADAHSDADFKKGVISFIFCHESVFKSDVWTEFCKEPSKLAMEVYQGALECKIKKS